MASTDPRDPDFDLVRWQEERRQEARRRAEEQRRRNAAWREDARTRDRPKSGPLTAPSYVSVPVPDPAPGEPRFVMVEDRRGGR